MPSILSPLVTNNEVSFVLHAISRGGLRASGRRPHDLRKPHFSFSKDGSVATVSLGSEGDGDGPTATASVRATLGAPFADRPGEGSLRCSADVSSAAAAALNSAAGGGSVASAAASLSDHLTRMLERSLSHARAVDLEQLCVSPGRAAWSVRVDACLVDAGRRGGASAASAAVLLAAVAALRSFRRPDATVEHDVDVGRLLVDDGGDGDGGGGAPPPPSSRVVVHPAAERNPVPLSLRITPVAVAFTFLWSGGSGGGGDDASSSSTTTLVLDPDAAEEQAASLRGYGASSTSPSAASGLLVSAGAPSGDVLFVDRGAPGSGGAAPVGGGISSAMFALRLASSAALEVAAELERALEERERDAREARVRRHAEGALDAAGDFPAAPFGLAAAAAAPVPKSAPSPSAPPKEEERRETEEEEMEEEGEKEEEGDEGGGGAAAPAPAAAVPKDKKKKKSDDGRSPSWRSDDVRERAGKRSKSKGGGRGGDVDTLEEIAAMIGGGGKADGTRPSLAAAATRKKGSGKGSSSSRR